MDGGGVEDLPEEVIILSMYDWCFLPDDTENADNDHWIKVSS
jgi:hypothetical protein